MPLDAGGQNLRRLFVHSSTRLQSCVTPRGHRSGPRRLQLHRAGPRMPSLSTLELPSFCRPDVYRG